jgi:hypothetical protein
MNMRFTARKTVMALLATMGLLIFCATMAHAQSAGTGAISGTLTDPQGRAVPNATVTAISSSTGQTRTATTGVAGDYKFSLLPPGNYKVRFTAAGFKSTEVSSVTVTVTETQVLDSAMEVGTVNQTVTVESNVETLQTESSTLGTTVNGSTITALPMANGNYTEVLGLAAGATASVDNATSLGKGTQDISANGVDPGSNNYQMDGVAVNNIANSGSSNDGTIYTGIPIPSPDAIGEFKIQTSTYDASYGRNPGANVNVVTKSGTNDFHGTGFEFFRNSVLNASDYFYTNDYGNAAAGKPHEILDQNQFGGTIGGPILKDKLFFFFSYRGTRAKNGVAPAGTTDGVFLPTALNPYAALGSRGTCGAAIQPDTRSIASVCDPTAQAFATALGITNIVGLRIFQLQDGTSAGVPNNYYLPAPTSDPQQCNPDTGECNFSVPALYRENQYVANGDWIINNKQTLSTRYFYTLNPQTPFLGQNGGNLPGTPEHIIFGNQDAVLKLTSLVTSNFVNEARVSYQRNTDNSSSNMPPGGTNSQLGIVPGTGGFEEPPVMIDIFDGFTLFGGLLPNFGPTNQVQLADQISWSHGKHSIRAGFEYEWTNWPLLDAGLQQGLMLVTGTSGIAEGGNAGPAWDVGCLFCVESIPGERGITHFYDVHNQSAYVLDDWKVSSKLTINVGMRWEYDGLLSDRLGRLTQVWLQRMAPNAAIDGCGAPPSSAACESSGIQQYMVASNFERFFGAPPDGVGTSRTKNSVDGHAPYSNFGPRIGFAWQPLNGGKLVVRGGFGIFYNRIGLDSLVHAFEQGAPYAQTYDFNPPGARWLAATLAQPYPALDLVPLASNPVIGFAPRFVDTTTANSPFPVDSGLSTPLSYTNGVHTPLVREYSFGIQYALAPTWTLDLGYVGSSGINLNNYNHNQNTASLLTPTNDQYGICQPAFDGSSTPVCNTVANAEFRVPYLGYEPAGLNASDSDGYSSYNSLQVTVRHQFSHGLSMQAAYTWSKDLSTVVFGNSANINNAACMNCQYGPVNFNRGQRLAINYSYDLPFGNHSEGLMKKVTNGWNVSGVTIAQSGDYLTIYSTLAGTAYGTSTTSYLTGLATPDYCPNFNRHNIKLAGGNRANGGSYFDANAFCTPAVVPFGDPGAPAVGMIPAVPAATGFGDVRSGIGEGPGQFNWDISVKKNTQITERLRLQFQTDFYNAFNHTQFSDPGSGAFGSVGVIGINTPANDLITHASVNPRLIQFGVHLFF